MANGHGGKRPGAGGTSTVNRVLARELQHTSGADFDARLSAVAQNTEIPEPVRLQALAYLTALLNSKIRYPNVRTIRNLERQAGHV